MTARPDNFVEILPSSKIPYAWVKNSNFDLAVLKFETSTFLCCRNIHIFHVLAFT